MEIDYSNIQNHFDRMVESGKSGTFKLVDKNRKVGNPNDESTIIELKFEVNSFDTAEEVAIKRDNFYCDWIRIKDNIVLIKDWFRRKYKD